MVTGNPSSRQDPTAESFKRVCMRISGYRSKGGGHLRKIDLGPCPFSWLAVDRHTVLLTVQNLQPLIHITDTDSLLKKRRQPAFRYSHSIILHLETQPPIAEDA